MDKLRNPNGHRRLRQIRYPGTVDATRPQVLINGEELSDIQPHVTPQELRDQFSLKAGTSHIMVCS